MGCRECCSSTCKCCFTCLSRIPYGTTVGLAIAITGMFMFVGGFVSALKQIDKMAQIKGALDFGYAVAGAVIGVAILLGILILLFACCSSGDTRANVYSGFKSKFIGKCFSAILMIIQYILYLAWALLSMFMVVPVLLQITVNAVCTVTPTCIDLKNLGLEPFLKYAERKMNKTLDTKICASELETFCKSVKSCGTPLLVSLLGTFVAALGTVHVLMCLSANYAYVKSFTKVAKKEEQGESIGMQ